jgi:SH3-like domain-containing protein
MNKYLWMIASALVSANLLAQQPAPAPLVMTGTNAAKPAAEKPGEKASAKNGKQNSAEPVAQRVEKTIVLVPGPATITGDNVNVRGRATFVGEILKRLKKGDTVNVIEQVLLAKPKAKEPSQWAKISYPAGANVWVHSSFIEATNSSVKPKRLNMRGGPGENYSVVGVLAQGDSVKEVSRKGVWIEIAAPEKAYAFVAAEFLRQDVTPPTVPPIISIPPTETTTVADNRAVVVPPVDEENTNDVSNLTVTTPEDPEKTEVPPPPRIVAHEGVVRPTVSIQAPTLYEIWDPKTRITINYLHSTSTNLDLSLYKNLRIVVTGEESLDARWKTPVITIQRIQVLD